MSNKVFYSLISPALVLLVYMLVLCAIEFYTQADCLRQGYPMARVTIGMERYCINIEGAVTSKIQKQ